MSTASSPLFSKILYLLAGLGLGIVLSLLTVYFVKNEKSQTETKTTGFHLQLAEPKDFTATNEKKVKLSGAAGVKSVITVSAQSKSVVLESKDGNFSTEVDLIEGKNVIDVTAFDPSSGESKTLRKEVLYLSEELNSL